jgi:UDP-4-amino-4,6-dideoxy-N-acetyl-beta-L-altrosamine transaminase
VSAAPGKGRLAIEGGRPVRAKYLPYGLHRITPADIRAVNRVLRGQWLTTGPNVDEFEKALAARVGAGSAAAVSSGTAALHLAYLAAGIGPGDEVITTPLTFAATANAALYVGARPVFADIDERTLNLDPAAAEAAVTPRTRAIVPVHYSGRPCEMDRFRRIARRHKLLLIEDACHALGAVYRGRPVGSGPADLAAWSFHPVKHVATGEGGAVSAPADAGLVEAVRRLRNHGINRDARARSGPGPGAGWAYQIDRLGYNYRMPDILAALGTSQLARLDANLAARRRLAAFYGRELARFEELRLPPADDPEHTSAWHLYAVRLRPERLAAGRAEVFAALRAEGIGVNVHYIPVYRHPLYARLGLDRGPCPAAERAYQGLLTLPLFPAMRAADARDVIRALDKVLARYRRAAGRGRGKGTKCAP